MTAAEKNAAMRKPRTRKPAAPKPGAISADDRAMAEKLLGVKTIPDRTWAPARGAVRNEGEDRAAFIKRVLLGES